MKGFTQTTQPCRVLLCVFSILIALQLAPYAQASVVLTSGNGNVTMGINDDGSLISQGVGLALAGVGDALTPGCPCESWGAQANGNIGFVGPAIGNSNISIDSFVSGATTAVSSTHLSTLPDLHITQSFGQSASGALFQDQITLSNLGSGALTGVQFARAMDWDVPPTEFNEFVTIGGLPASNVIYTGDNGFAVPFFGQSDLAGCGQNVNFTDCGPADHGAYFIFQFPDLALGARQQFNIFYGATFSETTALDALHAVGAEVFSLGESNTANGPSLGTPGTFIFGFSGVGGVVVSGSAPEPSTLYLLGLGSLMVGVFRRRLARIRG